MTDAFTGPLAASREGSGLQPLISRLLNTPPDFMAPDVATVAVVSDALDLIGAPGLPDTGLLVTTFDDWPLPTRLAAQVGAWLLTLPDLAAALRDTHDRASITAALGAFTTLVDAVPLQSWFGQDQERHEEVARALLRVLGMRPLGETPEVAEDRWLAVGSAARKVALQAAAREQVRAQELARRLADQRAKEAAAQYTHV
ncbi:hypothetical protein [Calidifontibacter terrae]